MYKYGNKDAVTPHPRLKAIPVPKRNKCGVSRAAVLKFGTDMMSKGWSV